MNLQALFDILLPILGTAGIDALQEKLSALLTDKSEPWKKIILNLVADAVQQHGIAGIQMALDAIQGMLKDQPVELDWADIATASDLLAELENAEAGRRRMIRSFLTQIGEILGIILSALIKGLLTMTLARPMTGDELLARRTYLMDKRNTEPGLSDEEIAEFDWINAALDDYEMEYLSEGLDQRNREIGRLSDEVEDLLYSPR